MAFLKKFGALLSVSVFLACTCIPSAAAELKLGGDSSPKEVMAKYSEGVAAAVYSVEIEWGSMSFEYTDETLVWNPETHKYDRQGDASWQPTTPGADKVTVKNHSNKPVSVAFEYTPATNYAGITGSFGSSSATLEAAAANSDPSTAPSHTATLTLSGALPSSVTASTVIGTAKVTLTTETGSTLNSGGGAPSNSPQAPSGAMNTSNAVGSIKLTSRLKSDDYPDYLYEAQIYDQGSNLYMAELCTDNVLDPAEEKPQTTIEINGTEYYIYEAGSGYLFEPGTTVDLNTSYYDDGENSPKRKVTAIEANKTYRLAITLNGDGTGTATLTEISS